MPGPCASSDQFDLYGFADEVLTTSHLASNAVEREHILSRGGDIPEHSHGERARVNGVIEVTRSLGDRWLKPVLDCTPEVVACELTEDDAFLIIGSDGLFDSVDDATVVRRTNALCSFEQSQQHGAGDSDAMAVFRHAL